MKDHILLLVILYRKDPDKLDDVVMSKRHNITGVLSSNFNEDEITNILHVHISPNSWATLERHIFDDSF